MEQLKQLITSLKLLKFNWEDLCRLPTDYSTLHVDVVIHHHHVDLPQPGLVVGVAIVYGFVDVQEGFGVVVSSNFESSDSLC